MPQTKSTHGFQDTVCKAGNDLGNSLDTEMLTPFLGLVECNGDLISGLDGLKAVGTAVAKFGAPASRGLTMFQIGSNITNRHWLDAGFNAADLAIDGALVAQLKAPGFLVAFVFDVSGGSKASASSLAKIACMAARAYNAGSASSP